MTHHRPVVGLTVELEEVTVRVDGAPLLAPVSATVARGHALIVRGQNGAGKSTLLGVVAGLRAASAGRARVGGRAISRRDPDFRRRVASMIGLPPMASDLTVRDHVRMIAATWFDSADAAERATDETLTALRLDALGTRFPHELSTGQRQLVGLALVLVRPAEVLVLDEPEQRLDPERIAAVIAVLAARRDRGTALVVATHSARIADALADDVLTLEPAT